jgi:hypothetical protein
MNPQYIIFPPIQSANTVLQDSSKKRKRCDFDGCFGTNRKISRKTQGILGSYTSKRSTVEFTIF